MAVCVRLWNGRDDNTGTRYTDALRLDTGGNTSACAYLLVSGPEWAAVNQDSSGGVFDLTPADGVLVGTAILGLWAVGWVWRAVREALNSDRF